MKFFPLTPVSISSHLEEMNKRREQPGNDVMNHCLYAVPLKFNSKQNHYGVGPTVESSTFCYYQRGRDVILACSDFLK
jgi:hypothetical protein